MHRTIAISLTTILVISSLIASGFVAPARAQFVDPVTSPAQVSLGIMFGAKDVVDRSENFIKDLITQTGAVLYKQALGTVVNTLAQDLARGLATGNFGGPIFSFDSGYWSALADGVVGDLVNDVVNGLTGIDLCNFDPRITLDFALNLPFLEVPGMEQYQPRCSLTKISQNLQEINLRDIVQVNVNIGVKTVGSFAEVASSFGVDVTVNRTVVWAAIEELNKKYGDENSEFNVRVARDLEKIEQVLKKGQEAASAAGNEFKEPEAIQKAKQKLLCEILDDVHYYNLGIVDGRDFADKYAFFRSDCLADSRLRGHEDLRVSVDVWKERVLDTSKGWLTAGTNDQRTGNAETVLTELTNEINKKAQRATTPIEKALTRTQALYNTCLVGLNRVLDVRIEGNQSREVQVAQNSFEASFGDQAVTANIDFGGAGNTQLDNTNRTATTAFLDVWPPDGVYRGAGESYVVNPSTNTSSRGGSFTFYVATPDERPATIRYTFDNSTPNCTTGQVVLADQTIASGDRKTATIAFNDSDADNVQTVIKALVCIDGDATRNPVVSQVQTFQYIIDSSAVVQALEERPLEQVGGRFRETFLADVPDPNNPIRLQDRWITYSMGGRKMNELEFAACQIVFNGGDLLRGKGGFGDLGYRHGANIFPTDESRPFGAFKGTNELGEFTSLFHPMFVEQDFDWFRFKQTERVQSGPDFLQAFIRYTVALDAKGDGTGQRLRDIILEVINKSAAMMIAAQETLLKQSNDIVRVFDTGQEQVNKVGVETPSSEEEFTEWAKSFEPASNEKATFSQLTKELLNEKYRKKTDEIIASLEKGTAINPDKTGVSELAKNPPEVKQSQLQSTVGGQNIFAEYTGQIFADGLNIFLATFWNQLLIRGLSELNPLVANSPVGQFVNIELSPELQQQIAQQEACRRDPAQCPTAVAGLTFDPNNPPCTQDDLNIITAWNNIKKSINANLETACASGRLDANKECLPAEVTDKCVQAIRTAQDVASKSGDRVSYSDLIIAMRGLLGTIQEIIQGIGTGRLINTATGSSSLAALDSFTQTVNRAESRAVTSEYVSAFDVDAFATLDIFPDSDFNILQELVTCPRGQANPSLYNCTIQPKFQQALTQKLTIREAIAKGFLDRNASVGITPQGEVPQPAQGFSLAAAQKLRKLRIMPLGFEFAARLKVACYQHALIDPAGDGTGNNDLPALFPYRDISGECVFGAITKSAPEKFLLFRDAVINANLGTIIDGFEQTGSFAFECGEFDVINGQLNMSPFCGLINPDWVVKLPQTQCNLYEYGEILESQSSDTRYLNCTEITSDIGGGNYGYCVKEENVWSFSGRSCPAEFASCQTYVFKDGSTGSFNRDSLVGEGLCNADNAGCIWVSTVKQGAFWQDTVRFRTLATCVAAGGTWDGTQCSNSRLYINDNVEFCTSADKGCSQVMVLKTEGNNIVQDGSFEFLPAQSLHPLWKAELSRQLTDTDNDGNLSNEIDACIDPSGSNGRIINTCTDVPFTNAATCAANGGTWNGTSCENAIIANVVQAQCGVCVSDGANPNADSSAGLLTQNDCLLANSNTLDPNTYVWQAGSFITECVLPTQACEAATGSCVLRYSEYNNNSDDCERFGGTYDSTDGTCRNSATEGAPEITLSASNKSTCEAQGGNFTLSCPLVVTNEDSSGGNNSLGIKLYKRDEYSQSLQSIIRASYPIRIQEEASTIILGGDTFSVGFDAKTNATTPVEATVTLRKTFNGGRVDSQTKIVPLTTTYQRITLTMTAISSGTDLTLEISIPARDNAVQVFVDQVKVEYNSPRQVLTGTAQPSNYSHYQSNASLYAKLPPDYLGCKGFNQGNPAPLVTVYSDEVSCTFNGLYWDINNIYGGGPRCYRFAPDAANCNEYAPICRAEDAGCQLYTPANGEPAVPGVVGQNDYCPAECVGYETFKQQPSYFEPTPLAQVNYFIPATAQQCAVESVGCDEFTNLASGAQNAPIEYYSYLKQCVVPQTGQGEAGFFIWQGTNNGTPQLRTFTLQAQGGTCAGATDGLPYLNNPLGCETAGGTFAYDGTGGPAVISVDGYCDAGDVGRDLDCLEFFDGQGGNHFRRLSYTIEASTACSTLRKTVSNEASCEATNGDWDGQFCLYRALPDQSRSCSAEVSGCREYRGNTGNNNFNVIFDNFETATPPPYTADVSTGLQISSESITRLGHSLAIANNVSTIRRPVGINSNRSYKISFWAKLNAQDSASIGVQFENPTGVLPFVTVTSNRARVTSDWQYFEFGPVFTGAGDVTGNVLVFENMGNTFIDNVTITSLQDSVYVVKDSWNTPALCNITNLGVSMPQAQLGCEAYTDAVGNGLNLKSFSKLCRESAIGCQLVFDTQNSTNPLEQTFNTSNASTIDDITVPADRLLAVVLNSNTVCGQSQKGCTEVGIIQEITAGFTPTLYIKNDPDRYTSALNPILCQEEALGCVEVANLRGERDFLKINFADTCTFVEKVVTENTSAGPTSKVVAGWFKDGVTEALGCAATFEQTETTCESNGGVWNTQYNQCTSVIRGLSFNNCGGATFDQQYKAQLADQCRTEYRGSWYDDGVLGCGCARNPFEYYRAWEYPDHNVSAARCYPQFDQCTEFLDFNPNYVFNGDYEIVSAAGQSTPEGWVEGSRVFDTGRIRQITGDSQSGIQSVRLYKDTVKDLPADSGGALINTPYYINQTIARLEKGRTYEINFDFKVDRVEGPGQLADYDQGNCRLPEAGLEIVPTPGRANPNADLQTIADAIALALGRDQYDYVNRQSLHTFATTGGWKEGKFKFTVPAQGVMLPVDQAAADAYSGTTGDTSRQNYCQGVFNSFYITDVTQRPVVTRGDVDVSTETGCTAAGYDWDTSESTCRASCVLTNPQDATMNYEVRVYGPMNGACVNQRTGIKRYFDDQGRPLDKYLCEGLPSAQLDQLALPLGVSVDQLPQVRYASGFELDSYADRLSGRNILDFDDETALGQNDGWRWDGNCFNSNIYYDRLQVAPERQSLYYFINDGSVDTRSCTGVNWEQGCIQFENTATNENVVIKVRPDRQCSEWLYCESRNAQGQCESWTTCSQQNGNECVRAGSLTDTLRYNKGTTTDTVQPIDRLAYQERFGVQEDFRANRWRDGEYSGYTIPNLPPLEQLYNQIPNTTQSAPTEFNGGSYVVNNAASDGYGINNGDDGIDRLTKICRGYPQPTSPFPKILVDIVPGFKNASKIINASGEEVAPEARATICNYVSFTINSQNKYFTDNPTEGICVKGDKVGILCSTGQACYTVPPTGEALANSCVRVDEFTDEQRQAFNQQAYIGNIGVCLEEEVLIKITGGFTGFTDLPPAGIIEDPNTELNQRATPRACLTFFPF